MKKNKDSKKATDDYPYKAAVDSVTPQWAVAVAAVVAPFVAHPPSKHAEELQKLQNELHAAMMPRRNTEKSQCRRIPDIHADIDKVRESILDIAYLKASGLIDDVRVKIYQGLQQQEQDKEKGARDYSDLISLEDVAKKLGLKKRESVMLRFFDALGYSKKRDAIQYPFDAYTHGIDDIEQANALWESAIQYKGKIGSFSPEIVELICSSPAIKRRRKKEKQAWLAQKLKNKSVCK